eukprot:TRINITY_DN38028_c0_g1_i1.p1 TRINITY_DN38028_c0_g1~~TRINITY_DN38028_c0_g1_i1.p1  ORF type:complete len:224 (+),score=66.46 TRINITY_DN38028_c0_g1_i1:51-674(+)
MVKAVPLKSTITDWKDERVVLGEEDLEQAVGKIFELIELTEQGKKEEKEAVKEEIRSGMDKLKEVDLGRALLLAAKLDKTENEVTASMEESEGAMEAVRKSLELQKEKLATCDAEWEEVGTLPKLLVKLDDLADLSTWKRKIDKAATQRNDIAAQAQQASAQVAELRTTFHYLLNKVAYISSTAERLSTSDSRKRRREEPPSGPSKK